MSVGCESTGRANFQGCPVLGRPCAQEALCSGEDDLTTRRNLVELADGNDVFHLID